MKIACAFLVCLMAAGCCTSAGPQAGAQRAQGQQVQTPSYTYQNVTEAYDGGTVFLELVPVPNDP